MSSLTRAWGGYRPPYSAKSTDIGGMRFHIVLSVAALAEKNPLRLRAITAKSLRPVTVIAAALLKKEQFCAGMASTQTPRPNNISPAVKNGGAFALQSLRNQVRIRGTGRHQGCRVRWSLRGLGRRTQFPRSGGRKECFRPCQARRRTRRTTRHGQGYRRKVYRR